MYYIYTAYNQENYHYYSVEQSTEKYYYNFLHRKIFSFENEQKLHNYTRIS